MWYPQHEFGWETLIFGSLMMILFWGGLIALFVWLFRAQMGPKAAARSEYVDAGGHGSPSRDALEILKARYAQGEISQTEFDQIRDDLSA